MQPKSPQQCLCSWRPGIFWVSNLENISKLTTILRTWVFPGVRRGTGRRRREWRRALSSSTSSSQSWYPKAKHPLSTVLSGVPGEDRTGLRSQIMANQMAWTGKLPLLKNQAIFTTAEGIRLHHCSFKISVTRKEAEDNHRLQNWPGAEVFDTLEIFLIGEERLYQRSQEWKAKH